MKHRHRRPGPRQNADVDALGRLREQGSEDGRGFATHQLELRREMPAGDMNELPGRCDRFRDRSHRLLPVDEHVERAALPGWRLTLCPGAGTSGVQRTRPLQALQPAGVLGDDCGFDASPDRRVEPARQHIGELWHRPPGPPQRRIPV